MPSDQPRLYHAIVQNSNSLLIVNEIFSDAEDARGYIETTLTEQYDETLAEWDGDETSEPQDWDDDQTWLSEDGGWYARTEGDNGRSAVVKPITPHASLHEALRSDGNLDFLPVEERLGDGVLRLNTTAEEHDVLEEVVEYRVGPAIDSFGTEQGQTVIRGLDREDLRPLMDACHDIEQEYSDDGFYDAAKAADRVEGKLARYYVPRASA